MKVLISTLMLVFTFTSMANQTLECVEFSTNPGEYETSLEEAAELLVDSNLIELVDFKELAKDKTLGCFNLLEEQDQSGGSTTMKLNEEKTNEYCVYTNNGIKPATYGWVCERMPVSK